MIWKNTNLPDKKRRKYAPIIPVNNPIELQGKDNREDKKGREDNKFGRVAVDKQPLPVHDPARTARFSYSILPISNKLKFEKFIKKYLSCKLNYVWKKIMEGRN